MPPRKSTRGNPPPPLTQDTVNRMIQESVKAAIQAERENFMKCSPITFHGNEGAVGLIRWIEKTEMVFTVNKCTEANKVVKTWAEIKVMMTEEFCPPEEIQRMKERKKVEAYICGLSENIKGEVTSFEPATLNKAVLMAYTLIEQKVKVIAEREADNKKRKWENFQGGSSGDGNNNRNRNNNNYNNNQLRTKCGDEYVLT
nr:hypothetical protein [Tanacetum cinerariifolium]